MIDTISLRKKIINLAMRGQLTEQLSSDGDADDLYVFVQQEKEKLIKEGKLKKEKALPDITSEEILFGIPNNWKWVRVGNIAEVAGGTTPKGEEVASVGSIPYFKVSDMNTTGNETHMIYASNYISESYSGRIFPAGTTIFPKNGGAALTNKRRLLVVPSAVDLNTGGCTPVLFEMTEWIRLYMDTVDFGKIDTGANIPTVNATNLKKQLIPLPPLAEQKRIVDKVNNALLEINSIDILQSQYSSDVEVLKSKIIDAGIQGKLTEQLSEDGTAEELYEQIQDEKDRLIKEGKIKKGKKLPDVTEEEVPFDIPNNWKWVRLGDVVRIYGGKRIPAGRSLTTENTGHKYIRVSDMKNETVLTDNLLYVPDDIYPTISRYIINKDDIYITVAGTIGKVGKIPLEIDGANLTENADRLVFDLLNQDWLIWCLSASVVQKQIEKLTTQVAQPKLAIKRIQEFMVPLPPLAEQKRIVNKVSEIVKNI